MSSPEEQAAAWRAAQANAAAYGQPAYPPQAYPPQPYPQPYYPNPYYGQAPGYYMPVYSQPASESSAATVAGVMWVLCLIRDVVYLLFYLVIGSAFAFLLPFGASDLFLLLALMPLVGIVGCGIAMASDFQRKNHSMGTVGAVLAMVGSSFPGIVVVGPVGIVLSVLGLVLHMVSKKDFKDA